MLYLRVGGIRPKGRRPRPKDGPRSREGVSGTPSFAVRKGAFGLGGT